VRPPTCRTWILPSSCQFGFLHLTIHVRYVRGEMMLIRCCFGIIVTMDSIYFASSLSSFKFLPTFGIVHHVLLQHLDFYSDHAMLFPTQVWGDTWEFHFSLLLCIVYICVCISFWLISFYLWLVLVFFFSIVCNAFTPLQHRTSWHYTSQ